MKGQTAGSDFVLYHFMIMIINFLLSTIEADLSWILVRRFDVTCSHRLSINRPTKRGKENSRSDGHCQCEKEMEDFLLACQ
jgi:hypothetical protein